MSDKRSLAARPVDVDTETLRKAIQTEYKEVARDSGKGFHFHTGRPLTRIVGDKDEWLAGVAESAIESFVGIDMTPAMPDRARATGVEREQVRDRWYQFPGEQALTPGDQT